MTRNEGGQRSNSPSPGNPFPSHAPSPLLRTPQSPGHSALELLLLISISPSATQAVGPPSYLAFSATDTSVHVVRKEWERNWALKPQYSGLWHPVVILPQDGVLRVSPGQGFCCGLIFGVFGFEMRSHDCAMIGFEFVSPELSL